MSTLPTGEIPFAVKNAFEEAEKYFPTPIQNYQFIDKYSRFNYEKGRRETWVETVNRAVLYLKELSNNALQPEIYEKIKLFILEMKVAPSMRLLAMAGDAARRQNISIYNCSATPLNSIDSFVEIVIIGMAGCGTGWSVEQKYVNMLPIVEKQKRENVSSDFWTIQDSTEGWAEAFKHGLTAWFSGHDPIFDYSRIRPAGAPLRTKGGTASGPEPLKKLLEFTKVIILGAQGRKLTTVEVHDIACKIAESIVSGGVRRVACISLFDFGDELMRNCKNGDMTGNEQRYMSNNSAVWPENISDEQITAQMMEMFDGMRGEPGIFSRENANKLAPERRRFFGYKDFLTNPCGEISLRPYQFCNLSQCLIRPEDTKESLMDKIEVATIIGTIQSMATHFPGLREIWKKNCEEERLLGVDLNGQMDNTLTQPSNSKRGELFEELKNHAILVNKKYAHILGINQSTSITCIKPNGNSGILYNCASGLHTRWAPYYIRRARIQSKSPLAKMLMAQHIPMSPENGQTWENATTYVISFPMKSPENALTRHDLSAIEQCENWLTNKKYWTEHNPSVTISYKEEEKKELLAWVLAHKEWIGGMSFLPTTDAQYEQMPNEEISKEKYELLTSQFPKIDFSRIVDYEFIDETTSSSEIACSSGQCDLGDYYSATRG